MSAESVPPFGSCEKETVTDEPASVGTDGLKCLLAPQEAEITTLGCLQDLFAIQARVAPAWRLGCLPLRSPFAQFVVR